MRTIGLRKFFVAGKANSNNSKKRKMFMSSRRSSGEHDTADLVTAAEKNNEWKGKRSGDGEWQGGDEVNSSSTTTTSSDRTRRRSIKEKVMKWIERREEGDEVAKSAKGGDGIEEIVRKLKAEAENAEPGVPVPRTVLDREALTEACGVQLPGGDVEVDGGDCLAEGEGRGVEDTEKIGVQQQQQEEEEVDITEGVAVAVTEEAADLKAADVILSV